MPVVDSYVYDLSALVSDYVFGVNYVSKGSVVIAGRTESGLAP